MKKSHLLLVAAMPVIGVIGGCETAPPVEEMTVESALEPAPKPQPAPVGTKVVGLYNDGPSKMEKVSIDGSLHTYESLINGCRWTEDAELGLVFAPSVRWENCNGSTGKRNLVRDGNIWPLEVGAEVSYTGTGVTSQTWSADTKCEVVDTVRVTVEAGTFDTYKVECSSPWRSTTKYYAPSVQSNVLTSQRRKGESSASNYDWELVRIESN